ncbi:MAG: Metallophosphoesterase [uncultured bacterium]|nr:MAG: Metallophosphoesterase [uncultured bacterium]KKP68500.1 MAG: Metallophosphoesterase [Candidatus Moranbacteria bacterium GW2011_GWE1_35_17]KKP72656.1 MAG: Metallophosphoesterase [Candidatus Moranbacteria bacterium GW2011_GWE2_35_164]KKP82687.1 MAG: Metallophosphoesterase [Candidatus Moranbacteria bacterium GW2011_GWF1_35_5]KKP83367.1 MAG: Metallophosphoesterase [Candidatus Moranbacteria bacterium GW2011_GWF2_35_54]
MNTYLGTANAQLALKDAPVKILNDELINIDGMQILGISYPERGGEESLAQKIKALKDFDFRKPNILLYHSPSVVKEAKDLGINLQLAGHTHGGQIFPFQSITYLIFGKYHSGLSQDGDFSIYTSVGTGTWGPMMRTSGRSEIVVLSFK